MSLKFESLEPCKGKKADLWLARAALETIEFQIFNKNVPLLGMAGALHLIVCMWGKDFKIVI